MNFKAPNHLESIPLEIRNNYYFQEFIFKYYKEYLDLKTGGYRIKDYIPFSIILDNKCRHQI